MSAPLATVAGVATIFTAFGARCDGNVALADLFPRDDGVDRVRAGEDACDFFFLLSLARKQPSEKQQGRKETRGSRSEMPNASEP